MGQLTFSSRLRLSALVRRSRRAVPYSGDTDELQAVELARGAEVTDLATETLARLESAYLPSYRRGFPGGPRRTRRWREQASCYGDVGVYLSVAGMTDAESLAKVRQHK